MTHQHNDWAKFSAAPAKRAALAELTRTPWVSPAVLGLLIFSTGGVLLCDVLSLLGQLSLGWACLLNSLLLYWQFTVAHDALHRSAARNPQLNEWLGRIGLLTLAPHVSMGLFRWTHVQHHRFTNGPGDPDAWMHGPWWSLPLRWALLDIGYAIFVIRGRDKIALRHLRSTLRYTAATVAVIAALSYLGYGLEVLLLWFIPSRIAFILTGFAFFWLPHVKNDVSAATDLTLASSVRLGHEWLLTPLLQYHNYHLIHHLYPTMPSYQQGKAWQLLKDDLRQRNLQVQQGFALTPLVQWAQVDRQD
jgi:beta-carotene hydroxylase